MQVTILGWPWFRIHTSLGVSLCTFVWVWWTDRKTEKHVHTDTAVLQSVIIQWIVFPEIRNAFLNKTD